MYCPVCKASVSTCPSFYELKDAYLSAAFLPIDANRISGYGQVTLVQCAGCGFVFNKSFNKEKIGNLYLNEDYVVKKNATPKMSSTLTEVYNFITTRFKGGCALEVAPGNGALAHALSHRSERVLTIDPSPSADESMRAFNKDNLYHIKGFFDAKVVVEAMNAPLDFVVARHLIEHLSDPRSFLEDIHKILSKQGIVYLEFPNFEEIVSASRFFDIFHDHFGYFSHDSFQYLCGVVGFEIIDKIELFSGQHMGYLLKPIEQQFEFLPSRVSLSNEALKSLSKSLASIKNALKNVKSQFAIWGAGAHGNTFLNCMEPDFREKITCCFDKDPTKAGRYLQGSRAKIEQPTIEKIRTFSSILVSASLYEAEIVKEITAMGFSGSIVKTAYLSETQKNCQSI